jgi:hypothetical protein
MKPFTSRMMHAFYRASIQAKRSDAVDVEIPLPMTTIPDTADPSRSHHQVSVRGASQDGKARIKY